MLKFLALLFNSNNPKVEAHDVLVFLAFAALVTFQFWAMHRGQEFEVAGFGEAIGIIVGGGAVGALGTGWLRRSYKGSGSAPDDPPGGR